MRLLFLYILLFTATNIFTQDLPADKLATKETIQFFHNLKSLMERGVMLDYQNNMTYVFYGQYKKTVAA